MPAVVVGSFSRFDRANGIEIRSVWHNVAALAALGSHTDLETNVNAPSEFDPILPPRHGDNIDRTVNWLFLGVAVVAAFMLIVVGMVGADRYANSIESTSPEAEPKPIDIGALPD